MTFHYETFAAGPIDTNAYLLVDGATGDAVIVDAPFDVTDELLASIAAQGATVKEVVLTHAHWDHIGDAVSLQECTGAPVLAHRNAAARLADPGRGVVDLPFSIPAVTPDRWIAEGDVVEVGEHRFDVLFLPGHDPAHIVLYSEPLNLFFGGDVVFPNGHGRIDIPGASESDMAASLARVAQLPGETLILPGHGLSTTIAAEPWLKQYRK